MKIEIIDSKKAYKAPQTKVIEVNVQSILCNSKGTPRYGEEELEPDIFG